MTNRFTVLGIGGSPRAGSTSERALRISLEAAERRGARTDLITGPELDLPLYDPRTPVRTPRARHLVQRIAKADGIILATPAYHGTVSGLVKNVLDYVEDLRDDPRPYFTGRAVGCLAVGQGWQGAVTALAALRTTTHALRGWPTPLGVPVNTETGVFRDTERCSDPGTEVQLGILGDQVVEFAQMYKALEAARLVGAAAAG
ncbi:NADPH-dependent FMN reductase [Streptomyces sindenensis]|uniref:NADPH-dependent FMN reductase n=1 Tax=Streptomyces sindenensis TaxID=67363 RepID=UPI0016767D58|nr:NAD(P)H-dependent oxidoreductase [Streptomyces sindenensis]GGP46347.1 FMN reductase [Streptomyces sindenensis]